MWVPMPIDAELREILRCPKCHGKLTDERSGANEGYGCATCRLFYPIVDEVPNFLVDEAKPL